jgi:hypothetical protein
MTKPRERRPATTSRRPSMMSTLDGYLLTAISPVGQLVGARDPRVVVLELVTRRPWSEPPAPADNGET